MYILINNCSLTKPKTCAQSCIKLKAAAGAAPAPRPPQPLALPGMHASVRGCAVYPVAGSGTGRGGRTAALS